MYLAKKYLILSLAEKCSSVLEASIKPGNVFTVLEQAMQFDEMKLESKCWDIVSKKTEECLNSEAFCNIELRTLNTLLKKRSLKVNEVDLFKAVLKWVDRECARQGINIEEDKTLRRRVLGDSVYDIYFLQMSQEDFAKYVSSTGILTETEVISIFQKLNGLDVAGLKWKKEWKRNNALSFSRFEVANVVRNGWEYNGCKSDALTVTVNKAVLFHGVRLFASSNRSQYEVKFTIKDENVTGTYTSTQDNDGVWGYDIMSPKLISLQQNETFTITATIKGPSSYAGDNGKSAVKVNDIVVTFTDAGRDLSTNGTSKYGGQFYKLYLSSL